MVTQSAEQQDFWKRWKTFRGFLESQAYVQEDRIESLLDLLRATHTYYPDLSLAPAAPLADLRIMGDLSIQGGALPAIDMSRTTFRGATKFEGTTFRGALNSRDCNFGSATFNNCTFEHDVFLQRTSFTGHVSFFDCRFLRKVDLSKCIFNESASFHGSQFGQGVSFDGSQFLSKSDFSNTQFAGVSFNNSKFGETTSFAVALFRKRAPTFHGAKLHTDTSFAGATFKAYADESDWRAYRTLKQMMAEVRAQEEESFFFAAEQRARRRFKSPRFVQLMDRVTRVDSTRFSSRLKKSLTTINQDTVVAPSTINTVVSVLYDFVSNYGQNIGRPFLLWFLQMLGFACLYFWMPDSIKANAVWLSESEPVRALMLSLQSSLNPLALFIKEPLIAVSSAAMFLTTLVQAIASVALIALGVLAIRRRFHKGSE